VKNPASLYSTLDEEGISQLIDVIEDIIKNGDVQLIINTPKGKSSQVDDSYLRKAAIKHKIPYVTTMAAGLAAAKGIAARRKDEAKIKSLQSYHKDLTEEALAEAQT